MEVLEADLDPILCLIQPPWAWFTTLPLAEQIGEDWDQQKPYLDVQPPIAPPPASEAWCVVKIAFECRWVCPPPHLSVLEINAGGCPWLIGPSTSIPAGIPLSEFSRIVMGDGGMVYLAKK